MTTTDLPDSPSYLIYEEGVDFNDISEALNSREYIGTNFDDPRTGRQHQPKGQPTSWRGMRTIPRIHFNTDAGSVFSYDGEKAEALWADQIENPSTPAWVDQIPHEVDPSDTDRILEIHSKVRWDRHDENVLGMTLVGNSQWTIRNQLRNSHGVAERYEFKHYELLNPIFKRIHDQAEWVAKDWTDEPTGNSGIRSMSLTIIQALGADKQNNLIYGRIFQPVSASDSLAVCREGLTHRALLSVHSEVAESVKRGDIVLVWTDRWVSDGGRVFDAVRQANTPPPSLIRANDDWWRINNSVSEFEYFNQDPAGALPYRVYGDAGEMRIAGGKASEQEVHFIHQNKTDAFNFWVANKMFQSMGLSGGLDADLSESIPDAFIPAYKDKRPAKVIDMATPNYPHYHDEIRCPNCNGRVLIKASADNTVSEADCPHCKASKAIKFPHLCRLSNATVKAVGLKE